MTGGPGDSTGTSPYVVTLEASLAGDEGRTLSSVSSLVKSGGSPSATVNTVATGGGMEVCNAHLDVCDFGKANVKAPGDNGLLAAVAVAPAGAPNEGDVLHVSPSARRIEEFTGNGHFVRTFGYNVNATEPGTGFEVCSAVSGHICQNGTNGSNLGQFGGGIGDVAEDSTGAIYVSEGPSANRRVQVFTPAGGESLTPSLFGTSEKQAVTVKATGGQFKLGFGVQEGGTAGTGTLTRGSKNITNVFTTKGTFYVGQPCNTVLAIRLARRRRVHNRVGVNTLTVSVAPGATKTNMPLQSELPYFTSDIAANAPASGPGSVEEALNALPSVNSGGGSVSVSGGPGDAERDGSLRSQLQRWALGEEGAPVDEVCARNESAQRWIRPGGKRSHYFDDCTGRPERNGEKTTVRLESR